MQLFGLDVNPKYAVVNMCDQHIVKMPSECYQLMITALWLHHVVPPGNIDCSAYKRGMRMVWAPTHKNHPLCYWVTASQAHFNWVLEHSTALLNEYTRRFKKTHMTSLFVDHLRAYINTHGFPPTMPQTVSREEWIVMIDKEKPKLRNAWISYIATDSPPLGCEFGLAPISMPNGNSASNNWVHLYQEYYKWKQDHGFKRPMRWSGNTKEAKRLCV